MEKYDDWAQMGGINQQLARREYEKMALSKAYGVEKIERKESVFEKIAYLKTLLPILKSHNRNVDVRRVVDEIESDVEIQTKELHKIFDKRISALEMSVPDTQIFCNNLKLSIQTCLEIIQILGHEKNKQGYDTNCQKDITHVIENFFEITKKYVSLFGECKYRAFEKRY